MSVYARAGMGFYMREYAENGEAPDVCAGIVLYNPDPDRLLENIGAVLPQVGRVILVDNGSNEIDRIRALVGDRYPGGVDWTFNGENKGIAFALNQIVSEAARLGFFWALTLDQDSICGQGLVRLLRAAARTDPSIAMVSPYIVDVNLISLESYKDMELPEMEDVSLCITSGCLTCAGAVQKCGGFDNELFIDQVDHEMCIRLRRAGYRVVRANRAYILHEVGKSRELYLLPSLARLTGNQWLARPKYISNHTPIRVYYQTRNLFYLLRAYPDCMGAPNRTYWAGYCRGVALKLLREPQKLKKLAAFIRGVWDGQKFYASRRGREGRKTKRG
jgi:rhamnosyltransferase